MKACNVLESCIVDVTVSEVSWRATFVYGRNDFSERGMCQRQLEFFTRKEQNNALDDL
jgi:hypothetical protein